MTTLLCLDTSTGTARVALVDAAGAVLACAEATADRHSAHVLKLCDEVLRAAGLTPAGLAGIACGAGPGSFTGLRVGLSVAKGLALATDAPLLLVSSLEALALDIVAVTLSTGDAWHVVPCIDAGKGEVYASAYEVDAAGHVALGGEPWRLPPAALAERLAELPAVVVAGNGAERHAPLLDGLLPAGSRVAVAGPTAVSIARLALPRLARGDVDDLETSVPLYGRPPDITTKKTTTKTTKTKTTKPVPKPLV